MSARVPPALAGVQSPPPCLLSSLPGAKKRDIDPGVGEARYAVQKWEGYFFLFRFEGGTREATRIERLIPVDARRRRR